LKDCSQRASNRPHVYSPAHFEGSSPTSPAKRYIKERRDFTNCGNGYQLLQDETETKFQHHSPPRNTSNLVPVNKSTSLLPTRVSVQLLARDQPLGAPIQNIPAVFVNAGHGILRAKKESLDFIKFSQFTL
jgi:hypothetical protein